MSMHLKAHMPALDGATDWIHGEPRFKPGQPVLVHFWAISCHVCHKNMPKLQEWRNEYVPKGLQLVAIHCPRMKSDVEIEKVRAAVERYGIVEPCAVDNRHKIKKAFENEFWPAYFFFDCEGKLVRRTGGNSGLAMLSPIIEKMLS